MLKKLHKNVDWYLLGKVNRLIYCIYDRIEIAFYVYKSFHRADSVSYFY